jgi:hypothetical protein
MSVTVGIIEVLFGRFGAAANLTLGTNFPPRGDVVQRDRTFGLGGDRIERDVIGHAA